MKNFYFITILFLLFSSTITAQKQIEAIIVDANTNEKLPFVTIELNKTSGVVSNSNGKFKMYFKKAPTLLDSLHINFLGYETKHIPVLNFKDSIIKLNPKPYELDEVIVLNLSLIHI